MSDLFSALMTRAKAWCEQAHAASWLDDADVARIAAVEQRTPDDLFTGEQARPLVVALFGGTGVGKSSLVNRLAGEEIARTGVERPTSREVTLYAHESVELATLPEELPVKSVQIKRHTSDQWRDVLWIDAPDIDSTEEANRQCALAWLPHVDLVCYVVSPERYRDDVGWRVLHQRGHKHGWMFVLNHWDEGDASQRKDFRRMLVDAGFDDPLLFVTCCSDAKKLPSDNEFPAIQEAIEQLRQAHGLRELSRLGHRARLLELRQAMQAAEKRLGDTATWEKLTGACCEGWERTAVTIIDGAEWSLRTTADRLGGQGDTLWKQLRKQVDNARRGERKPAEPAAPAKEPALIDHLTGQLWDDWAQGKLIACLDTAEVAIRRAEVAPEPLRQKLDGLAEGAGAQVTQHLRDSVRTALAKPGSALQRAARRVTGFLMAFLPMMAFLWVGWAVVAGYYHATQQGQSFRGGDFAIHSGLLLLISWAVPFAIDRVLRPAMDQIALRALRLGLQFGLDEIATQLRTALDGATADAGRQREVSQGLQNEIASLLTKPIDVRAPAIARLVKHTPAAP